MGEIALRVRDLDAMTSFYRDVVGLEAIPSSRQSAVWSETTNAIVTHSRGNDNPKPTSGAIRDRTDQLASLFDSWPTLRRR